MKDPKALFRGTADPFGRELPVVRVADAVELQISNASDLPVMVRFRARFKDLGTPGEIGAYISLKAPNNTYTITPRPLISGAMHALSCGPTTAQILRIDFPHAFAIEEFTMFFKNANELDALSFGELKYLGRDGAVGKFDLTGAEAGIDRLIERLSTMRAAGKPDDEHELVVALKDYSTTPTNQRSVKFGALIRQISQSLPLTTPANLLLTLLDGVPECAGTETASDDVIELIAVIALCALKREGWLSTTGLESFKAWLTDIPTIERFMAKLNADRAAASGNAERIRRRQTFDKPSVAVYSSRSSSALS